MFLSSNLQVVKGSYKASFYALLLTLLALMTIPAAQAHESSENRAFEHSTEKLATSLVTRFWDDVKRQDVEAYSSKITTDFRGLNISGIYNKENQVSGLEGLTLNSFELHNLFAARYNNTIEISYEFVAQGEGVTSGPSLDTWHKSHGHWRLISHSYVPYQ